jgi:hypothetical protein
MESEEPSAQKSAIAMAKPAVAQKSAEKNQKIIEKKIEKESHEFVIETTVATP